MRLALIPIMALVLLPGCFGGADTMLVPDQPFGVQVNAPTNHSAYTPAPVEVAARVDRVGRAILAQNKQTGIRPLFVTIGAPQPEIFHRGTKQITVTEGLVRQCQTDGVLAAVLCHELGKMVAEREAMALPAARDPSLEPPPQPRIGNNSGSFSGPPDQTHLAEVAHLKPRHRRPKPPPPPSPDELARQYLIKAGHAPQDLAAAAPILQAAQDNSKFEMQLKNQGPARPWTK